MKKSILFLIVILYFTVKLFSSSYTVKQDGTGDFTSIQAAINASTNGSTIIVYPGRYYENVNFSGKNIYLSSLYSMSNDRNDIYNTIIDANHLGSGVVFENGETRQAVLNGFTIENGIGHLAPNNNRHGGGIFIAISNPSILNCIIQNNSVLSGAGGGMMIVGYNSNAVSNPYLAGNIVKNNNAYSSGGGIHFNSFGIASFDSVNKNSVFSNFSSRGYDIFSYNDWGYINVVLDTFTVATDDYSFINMHYDYDFSCDNNIIDSFINHDLYVSPDGDDHLNDGLSSASPLKTISYAMYHIASDSLNPKTIHLAPGVYTRSGSGQRFPVHVKSYVNIAGAGRDLSILDSEQTGGFFSNVKESKNIRISGIGFQNNSYVIYYKVNRPIWFASFKSIEISDCAFRDGYGGIADRKVLTSCWDINNNSQAVFKNLLFDNNKSQLIYMTTQKADFENIIIKNSHAYFISPFYYGGTPISPIGTNSYRSYYSFSNILIYDNDSYLELEWPILVTSNAFLFSRNQDILINNATVVGNALNPGLDGGPVVFGYYGNRLRIFNSIFYNNTPGGFWFIYSPTANNPNHLYIKHSLIEGGESAVQSYFNDLGVNNLLYWGNGNLDTNPMFQMTPDHPYQLSEDSPCIDAGTLDIPDYTFPETDIMGNPRISGASVDIGAYEYQGLNANFTAIPLSGKVPLEVQFSDLSTGVVFSWAWDFDLNGYFDSYEQNPIHTYTEPGIYSVRLVINNGEKSIIKEQYIDVLPTSKNDESYVPLVTNISDPFPNPFKGRTMFNATINEPGLITVNIYNIKGQKIKSLVNQTKDVGIYSFVWNGTDDNNKQVTSGIYNIEFKHNNKKIGVIKASYIK